MDDEQVLLFYLWHVDRCDRCGAVGRCTHSGTKVPGTARPLRCVTCVLETEKFIEQVLTQNNLPYRPGMLADLP